MRTFSIDMVDDHDNIKNVRVEAEEFTTDPSFVVFTASGRNVAAIASRRVVSVVASKQ